MSRLRTLRVYYAARDLVAKLNKTLRAKPHPRTALELEHYLRDFELDLQTALSQAFDAGPGPRQYDSSDAA
jgi:hypothetical protein